MKRVAAFSVLFFGFQSSLTIDLVKVHSLKKYYFCILSLSSSKPISHFIWIKQEEGFNMTLPEGGGDVQALYFSHLGGNSWTF